MIQVQIASQLTLHGVDGVRWVLVEVADTAHLSAAPPAAVLAGAPPAEAAATAAQRPPRALSLALLKLLVTGLGIGAALWVAQGHAGAGPSAGMGARRHQHPATRSAADPHLAGRSTRRAAGIGHRAAGHGGGVMSRPAARQANSAARSTKGHP